MYCRAKDDQCVGCGIRPRYGSPHVAQEAPVNDVWDKSVRRAGRVVVGSEALLVYALQSSSQL